MQMRTFTTAEGLPVHLCSATGRVSVDAPEACLSVRGGFVCDEPVCCCKSTNRAPRPGGALHSLHVAQQQQQHTLASAPPSMLALEKAGHVEHRLHFGTGSVIMRHAAPHRSRKGTFCRPAAEQGSERAETYAQGLGKTVTMMALILKTRGVCAAPPEGVPVVQPLGAAAGSACISPAYYELPVTGAIATPSFVLLATRTAPSACAHCRERYLQRIRCMAQTV